LCHHEQVRIYNRVRCWIFLGAQEASACVAIIN